MVTRGAVVSERIPGGFAGVYKVLRAFEDSGRCRRGYFVDRASAPPSSAAPARSTGCAPSPSADPGAKPVVVALAATDPANAYGAALPWPERRRRGRRAHGHRPGRKAGAMVVLVDGALTLYVERGGRTLLTWTDDPDVLAPATAALADAARRGASAAHRREGRRRGRCSAAAARRCGRAPGRRLPGDTQGAEAPCLRATPSGARHARSTGRWPGSG